MWQLNLTILATALIIFAHTAPACASKETEQEQLLRISRQAFSPDISMTAAELHEKISANDTSYYIVSLQNSDEFAKGHIPGAHAFSLDYTNPEPALALLPRNKVIVVCGPNGQESCQMTIFLRQLGYDAKALLLGMQSWNKEFAGTGAYPAGRKQPLANAPTPLPLIAPEASKPSTLPDNDIILQKTRAYASQGRPVNISHEDLAAMKDSALIISMQSPEDYAFAHIPGAANLPAKTFIAGDHQLLQLPRNKKIVVTCYIGHYSNIGAMILNQLGYEAYSLDWGLAGWNISGFKTPSSLLQTDNRFPTEGAAKNAN